MGLRRLFRLALRTPEIVRSDADDELDAFLEERIEQLVHRGMAPAEARVEALRRLGGSLGEVRRLLRHSAERREGRMAFRDAVDHLLQDVRYAVRGLARQPRFTAAAILCLAIGIGATSTMFGVVDALLLRPPPGVRDQGNLVRVGAESTDLSGTETRGIPYADYVDFSRSPALDAAALYAGGQRSFGRGTAVRQVEALTVSHTFLPLLGARPVVGRFFTAEEERAGGPAVIVLGYAFWHGQFAGAKDVVGKAVRVGTNLYTVIGVAPRDFNGLQRSRVDVYLPLSAGDFWSFNTASRDGFWLNMLARPKPGVHHEALAKELDITFHRSDAGYKIRTIQRIVVTSPSPMITMRDRQQMQNANVSPWLAAVAAIVLLIACANVASLLLTRAVRRRREIAVRLSLGVGRGRLVRMLLTESLMLATAGGVVGVIIAVSGGSILRLWLLSDLTVGASPLESRGLVLTLVVTVFTGLLCGLAPALQMTRPDLTEALKSGSREGTEGRGYVLSALLVGQVALTLVLLVGAGLFVRSMRNLGAIDLGFDAEHVLRAVVAEFGAIGYTPAQTGQFFDRLLERTRSLPGVDRAALATTAPFGMMDFRPLFSIPGRTLEPESGLPPAISAVTPEFFATLGMSLRSGRALSEADRSGAERVAVVNEAMAQYYWPRGDAIGQCIKIGGAPMPCTTIVGVVANTARLSYFRDPTENGPPIRVYYLPFDQQDSATKNRPVLYVRTSGDATSLVPTVRRTIQTMLPDLPFVDVSAFSTVLEPQFRPWRLGVTMFGIFGGIALALAVIGLYGALAFRVSQRTHEIGVRMALGAQRGDLRRLVLSQGLRLSALGVAIGLGAALTLGRALDALLFHVSAKDPLVLMTTGAALLAVALLASYLPALRATRVDPMEALRDL